MKSLERIHQQILEEAKLEAKALRDAAEERKKVFLRASESKADELYENALAEVREKQRRTRSQLKAELSMTERSSLLATKQEWIHKVLTAALNELATRSKEEKINDYIELLKSSELQVELKEQPNSEVIVDIAETDRDLLEDLTAKLPFSAKIRCNRTDFTAGLIVNVGLVHFNYTYEEDMRRREADFIGTIGNLLFQRKE